MHVLIREQHGLGEAASVEDLGQSPAELVVLSFSDSDLSAFAAAKRATPGLPTLRLANIARLAHPMSVDLYVEATLSGARGCLVRLLGGKDYWAYGVDELAALAARTGLALAVVPGDGRADPRLQAASNLPASTLKRLEALCDQGGAPAAAAALAQLALASGLPAPVVSAAAVLPKQGFDRAGSGPVCPVDGLHRQAPLGRAALVSYRSFLAAADTAPIDALETALEARGFAVDRLFVPSLKDPETTSWLSGWLRRLAPQVIVNATAFSARGEGASPFDAVDAPVLQIALAGARRSAWAQSSRGLTPADLAMHVVLPEVDGRIFAGAVSFKEPGEVDPDLGSLPARHRPDPDGIAHAADRAAALVRLRRTPAADKRLALVLSTYPGRADQSAHAVGLDAPASTAALVTALSAAGYRVDPPGDGAALLAAVETGTVTWPLSAYRAALAALPDALRAEIDAAWGAPDADPDVRDGHLVFRASTNGHVVVALQPERGRPEDRASAYHDQRRPPRHAYVAFHLWLRAVARVDAIVHMGAHGTLEWLPGKAVALSGACWPRALAGATPVIYPFIVNDPGEAAAAKRRIGAITIGHLPPKLSRAGVPDALQPLERLLDEWSNADGLDPRRRDRLARDILGEARAAGLDRDAGLHEAMSPADALVALDAFVCDVKATQFADGLHVLGREAPGEIDSVLAALAGRHVAPGPSGSPYRGRADVLPTGRNLFTVDPRAVPTRAASDQGAVLARTLLDRHLQDTGSYPREIIMDLWGSSTMRTAGETFAMALALVGAAPVWDHGSGRVSGFEIVPLARLGRPRIAVTLRLSGLFRDVFPSLVTLYDQVIAALKRRDEAADENPFVAADGTFQFGPAPESYGIGAGAALTDMTPAGRDAVAEAWRSASVHAYCGDTPAPAPEALNARLQAADAHVHVRDLPESDLLSGPDTAAHIGGALAARAGRALASIQLDASDPDRIKARALPEELARIVRARAANPAWVRGQLAHGHAGAAAIAATVDQLAAFARLTGHVGDHLFDLVWDATLGDDAVVDAIDAANPAALDELRRRFRDLMAAGLWRSRRNSPFAEAAE